MPRARFAALVLVAASLLGASGSGPSAAGPDITPLQGAWEVLAVHRDGALDPTEVGSRLTFHGDLLKHEPKVVTIGDLTTMQGSTVLLDDKALARMAMS